MTWSLSAGVAFADQVIFWLNRGAKSGRGVKLVAGVLWSFFPHWGQAKRLTFVAKRSTGGDPVLGGRIEPENSSVEACSFCKRMVIYGGGEIASSR